MLVSRFRFAPGSRTAWHGRGQTLHVTPRRNTDRHPRGHRHPGNPGPTIYTPPGQEHWHGATPEDFTEHLAMLETADVSAAKDGWFEHATDDTYSAAAED